MSNRKRLFGEQSALLIDPSVVGQSHLLVNTGIVHLAATRYKRIIIIAESTHCDALKQYLGKEVGDQVTFIPWRRRKDIKQTIRKFIARQQFDQIIFTNLEYNIFAYMGVFHRKASRNPPLWVFHSHIVNAAASGKAARFKNLIKLYFLFRVFRRVRFIVLGERIRSNFEALISPFFRLGNITSIIHPIGIARLQNNSLKICDSKSVSRLPRVIFMSGWHTLSPQNQTLLKKLESISSESKHFELIARSNKFEGTFNRKSFSMEYVDRLTQIAEADFFLHLPSDSYRLQASGAVMDMLLTGTPIIGLRTDFGEELTEIIGQFGYFFDNQNDLINFFCSAVLDSTEFERFKTNLEMGYNKIMELSQNQFDALIVS